FVLFSGVLHPAGGVRRRLADIDLAPDGIAVGVTERHVGDRKRDSAVERDDFANIAAVIPGAVVRSPVTRIVRPALRGRGVEANPGDEGRVHPVAELREVRREGEDLPARSVTHFEDLEAPGALVAAATVSGDA